MQVVQLWFHPRLGRALRNRKCSMHVSLSLFRARVRLALFSFGVLATGGWPLLAQTLTAPPTQLQTIVVTGRAIDFIGTASSSSKETSVQLNLTPAHFFDGEKFWK